ncbi:MAG TPA: nucleotidyltransferase domain-containing protein [Bacteroidales bacterium]|nr:nucleotidyltransferase domain-containing protein [Bacteroidales bacterium]HPS46246.1 nucleotidyltransferase domain-containing protein [Bacteroidales bacterium]HQH18789.1 nucleotidyltransferase domain-containing protein [Bacteroidales bacterium]HQI44928.1 nucleotidyltransferase domain-containing protein [Bacteroidales bacterium]
MSQKDAINIIRAYLQVLKNAGINIEKAYLYGSYATNVATPESDIDVLLVSSLFDTDDDYILAKPWLFTGKVDYRIEPLAIGSKRFAIDDTSPIIELVRQTGIEVTA